MEKYEFKNRNLLSNLLRHDEREEEEQLEFLYKISIGKTLNPETLQSICSCWVDTTFR